MEKCCKRTGRIGHEVSLLDADSKSRRGGVDTHTQTLVLSISTIDAAEYGTLGGVKRAAGCNGYVYAMSRTYVYVVP